MREGKRRGDKLHGLFTLLVILFLASHGDKAVYRMTLGEAYLKDIIRPPPTGSIPANVAHPFQTSFYTYFTKKFIPRSDGCLLILACMLMLAMHSFRHWYLAAGATFTLTVYGVLDSLREQGKKAAFDEKTKAGLPTCECRLMMFAT